MSYLGCIAGNLLNINGLRGNFARITLPATQLATRIARALGGRRETSRAQCRKPAQVPSSYSRIFDCSQQGQQGRNIRHDDAPQRVVIDA